MHTLVSLDINSTDRSEHVRWVSYKVLGATEQSGLELCVQEAGKLGKCKDMSNYDKDQSVKLNDWIRTKMVKLTKVTKDGPKKDNGFTRNSDVHRANHREGLLQHKMLINSDKKGV